MGLFREKLDQEVKDPYRYLPESEVILHDAVAVCSTIRNTHTPESNPPLVTAQSVWVWCLSECPQSRSPVIQTHRQVTAVLHKHRSPPLDVSRSAHLYLHTRSTADGTHLEINDSRGSTGPAGDSGTSVNTPATHLAAWPNTHSLSSMVIHSSESASRLVLTELKSPYQCVYKFHLFNYKLCIVYIF